MLFQARGQNGRVRGKGDDVESSSRRYRICLGTHARVYSGGEPRAEKKGISRIIPVVTVLCITHAVTSWNAWTRQHIGQVFGGTECCCRSYLIFFPCSLRSIFSDSVSRLLNFNIKRRGEHVDGIYYITIALVKPRRQYRRRNIAGETWKN